VIDVAYIALGSNLGDREHWLTLARQGIAALERTTVLGATAVEETGALGPVPQGSYLNQMIAIRTELTPHELLARLHDIERAAGRTRRVRWGPRTLDLDIVCFDRQAVASPELTVPHPELPNRDFWLRELGTLRRELGT
jgi:2-amino-4-hydroxy-6-hydroxymethyldihydropteridine diphosphokinase